MKSFIFNLICIFLLSSCSDDFLPEENIEVVNLHLACPCPNWIETKHAIYLDKWSIGQVQDSFAFYLIPASKEAQNHFIELSSEYPTASFRLRGSFSKNNMLHEVKGTTFYSKTFKYETIELKNSNFKPTTYNFTNFQLYH